MRNVISEVKLDGKRRQVCSSLGYHHLVNSLDLDTVRVTLTIPLQVLTSRASPEHHVRMFSGVEAGYLSVWVLCFEVARASTNQTIGRLAP